MERFSTAGVQVAVSTLDRAIATVPSVLELVAAEVSQSGEELQLSIQCCNELRMVWLFYRFKL